MERLTSPNGVEVQASDAAVAALLACGYRRAAAEEPKAAKPKAAPRKRAAKPKEE